MKAWLYIGFVAVMLLGAGSCKDACRSQLCLNGGFCYDGECFCEKWYSGESCELLYNRNYDGTYYGSYSYENGARYRGNDSLTFEADPLIPNRLLSTDGFYLDFVSDSTLVMPLQNVVSQNDTFTLEGEGKYGLNWIELSFVKTYETLSDGQSTIYFIGELVEKDGV